MFDSLKKFQLVFVLLVMITGFGITWGKVSADVAQTKVEQASVVEELKKIREEIVKLRIETAVSNQKLESHLITHDK
jgi:hypothetical protein